MTTAPEWGTDEHLQLELRHLDEGSSTDAVHVGLGPIPFRFSAADPELVVARVREVLRASIVAMLNGWDGESDEVPEAIPAWFRDACAPDGKSSDDHWSLNEWLWWTDPDERQWFWWDARVIDARTGEVRIETTGLPYPSGALRWLLSAAGARDVREDED